MKEKLVPYQDFSVIRTKSIDQAIEEKIRLDYNKTNRLIITHPVIPTAPLRKKGLAQGIEEIISKDMFQKEDRTQEFYLTDLEDRIYKESHPLEIIRLAENYRSVNPDNMNINLVLADSYMEMGAILECLHIARYMGNSKEKEYLVESNLLVGEAFKALGRFEEAEKTLLETLDISQDSFEILYELGDLVCMKKDYEAATRFFTRALKNAQNEMETYMAKSKLETLEVLGNNEIANQKGYPRKSLIIEIDAIEVEEGVENPTYH